MQFSDFPQAGPVVAWNAELFGKFDFVEGTIGRCAQNLQDALLKTTGVCLFLMTVHLKKWGWVNYEGHGSPDPGPKSEVATSDWTLDGGDLRPKNCGIPDAKNNLREWCDSEAPVMPIQHLNADYLTPKCVECEKFRPV